MDASAHGWPSKKTQKGMENQGDYEEPERLLVGSLGAV